MRIARKLLIPIAVFAIAFAASVLAPAVSAQPVSEPSVAEQLLQAGGGAKGPPSDTPVEVVREGSDSRCPALPKGCRIHAYGSLAIDARMFGIELDSDTECGIEFDMGIGPDGKGRVTASTVQARSAVESCGLTACGSSGGGMSPWPTRGYHISGGAWGLSIGFCFDDRRGMTSHFLCQMDMSESVNHDYMFNAQELECVPHRGLGGEISGEVSAESDIGQVSPEFRLAS